MAASRWPLSPAAAAIDRQSLTTVGLLDKFDILVCAEDYARGKPAPDASCAADARRRAQRLPGL